MSKPGTGTLLTSAFAMSRLRRLAPVTMTILGGGLVAYLTSKVMVMQTRYFVAAVLGALILTTGLVFLRRLPDLLLYLSVLCIPLMTFEKTFQLTDTWVDFGTPGFNVGLLDLILAALYAIWWLEVFGLRTRPLPRLTTMDGLVLAYVVANVLSLISSASAAYTTFEIYRVSKYALAYFYIAHRLERRHLMGVIVALMIALVFESAFGVFQYRTHRLVGIARSKGAATAELDTQYEVPEFEGHRRAEGTTIDSHALGAYLDMLLPFAFCLAIAPWLRPRSRAGFGAVFLIGIAGLIATFSRGAWLAFVIALTVILVVYSLSWREHRALKVSLVLGLLASPPILIGGGMLLGKRVFRAPHEIMSARWDTVLSGYEIWKQNPLTGRGANAYFHAQRDLGKVYDLTNDKPAHNIALYLLAQMGLVGILAYLSLGLYTCAKCLSLIRRADLLLRTLALAVLAGVIAVQADGLVDFMSFTNQVYYMQFLCCALVSAMLSFPAPGEADPTPDPIPIASRDLQA
jgi:O-antigen ligase